MIATERSISSHIIPATATISTVPVTVTESSLSEVISFVIKVIPAVVSFVSTASALRIPSVSTTVAAVAGGVAATVSTVRVVVRCAIIAIYKSTVAVRVFFVVTFATSGGVVAVFATVLVSPETASVTVDRFWAIMVAPVDTGTARVINLWICNKQSVSATQTLWVELNHTDKLE